MQGDVIRIIDLAGTEVASYVYDAWGNIKAVSYTHLDVYKRQVQKWGIIGVLFATVVALPIKVIYCTYVCDKKILRCV